MIDHTILKEVRNFLSRHDADYRKLVDLVREAAEEVQTKLGREVVHDIYSRGKHGGPETKDPIKIAIKLGRKRTTDREFRVEKINDIVGLTVSVLYHEYVSTVVDNLCNALAARSITTEHPSIKAGSGYYATHIDCTAQGGAYDDFMCEIQVKTLLHSAWGVKTHDLTYKPQGYHDHGLNEMSRSIGDIIETVERQSSELHRLIRRQWEIEHKTRDEATHRFFLGVTRHHPPSEDMKPTFEEFFKLLEDDAARLSALPEGDPEIKALQSRITGIAKTERQAWQLAVALSHLTECCDQRRSAVRLIERFRDVARTALAKAEAPQDRAAAEASLFVAISALYVLGAHEETLIDSYETLELQVSEVCRSNVAFNLATYLIERECHLPSRSDDVGRSRAEIDRLLGMVTIELPAEIKDTTYALIDIAFSGDAEVIQRAITVCGTKMSSAPEGEREVAEAYSKYYVALGWRRLFRIR